MSVQTKRRSFIKLALVAFAACLLYGISSGIRANYGILINGISQNSGIPYSSVSFRYTLKGLFACWHYAQKATHS